MSNRRHAAQRRLLARPARGCRAEREMLTSINKETDPRGLGRDAVGISPITSTYNYVRVCLTRGMNPRTPQRLGAPS